MVPPVPNVNWFDAMYRILVPLAGNVSDPLIVAFPSRLIVFEVAVPLKVRFVKIPFELVIVLLIAVVENKFKLPEPIAVLLLVMFFLIERLSEPTSSVPV